MKKMSVFSSLQTFFKGNRSVEAQNEPKSSKRHLPEGTYNRLVQIFDMDAESMHASRRFFETGHVKPDEEANNPKESVDNTQNEYSNDETCSSPKIKQ